MQIFLDWNEKAAKKGNGSQGGYSEALIMNLTGCASTAVGKFSYKNPTCCLQKRKKNFSPFISQYLYFCTFNLHTKVIKQKQKYINNTNKTLNLLYFKHFIVCFSRFKC